MAPPALATATSAHRANATSPQRIGPVRAWVCAAHRTAQRTAPRSAPHRAAHCTAQMQKKNLGSKFHFLPAGGRQYIIWETNSISTLGCGLAVETFLENKSEMCLFSPFVLMSV